MVGREQIRDIGFDVDELVAITQADHLRFRPYLRGAVASYLSALLEAHRSDLPQIARLALTG
jgi:hypothetical protein